MKKAAVIDATTADGYPTGGDADARHLLHSVGWWDVKKTDVLRRFDVFLGPLLMHVAKGHGRLLDNTDTDDEKRKIRIIDVGAGSCLLAHWLAARPDAHRWEYVGIEPSAERLSLGKKHFPKALAKSAKFYTGYAGPGGPLAGEKADIVVASGVMCDVNRGQSHNLAPVSKLALDMMHHGGWCVADFWHKCWWQDAPDGPNKPSVFADPPAVRKAFLRTSPSVVCSEPILFDDPLYDDHRLFYLVFRKASLRERRVASSFVKAAGWRHSRQRK